MSSSECPHCGYSPPSIQVGADSMRSQQEEFIALQADLRRIEDSISRLAQARSAVLRKINNVQSATSSLPPEVLSIIFQIARPPIDFDVHYLNLERKNNAFHTQERFLYVLAAVSHRWRQVAFSIPQLWTNVRLQLDYDPSSLSVERNMSLLNLHIQNSRNTPMSIELDWKKFSFYGEAALECALDDADDDERLSGILHQRERSIEVMEPLRSAVFVDQAPKIQDLIVICPPVEWFQFTKETLSQCKSVTIFQPQREPYELLLSDTPGSLDLSHLPCLQRVQLIDCQPKVAIPSSISTLHLRKQSREESIRLLMGCRNLVYFEAIHFVTKPQETPQPLESVVLPHLEHFRWSNRIFQSNHMPDIERLQMPVLRSLVWSDDQEIIANDFAGQVHLHDPFFSHLPPSLSSLTFTKRFTRSGNFTIEHLLNCVPQVSELRFVDCSELTVRAAVNAIGRPFSSAESEQDGSLSIVLPKLNSLSVLSNTPYKRLRLPKTVDMLEALHEIGERRKHFQLNIEGATWNLDGEILHRLGALVKSGFDLEVVIDRQVLKLSKNVH